MGIESINKELYIIYSEKVTPICMTLFGLISFFLCYPTIGPSDYESITVAIAGLYMAIESSDEFINELCEYKLEACRGESTKISKILQYISISFTSIVFIFFITILIEEHEDPTVVIEVIIMMIIGMFRICETAMEIYYMNDAAEYVKLMYEIQDGHLISVIRDAYRLYLACNQDETPDENEQKLALKAVDALAELAPIVLQNLQYKKRVNMIRNILQNNHQSDEYNGTNATIWDEFHIPITNAEQINKNIPKILLDCLEEPCPFSNDNSIKVKQTHIWCFIPGNNVINIPENDGLTSKVLGEYCKNFIPGIGVIWRYPPFDENIENNNFNGKNRWILMYKGGDGIVPETFNKTWDESISILNDYNGKNNGGRTTEKDELKNNIYDTMTLLEVIACTYTHFVQTGKKMYQEKFTRVKEQVNSDEYGVHHLYIGRFNMSGLNNDAYLDVGGNDCRFHLRGLSVCKRFMVE
eukprot:90899_1